MYKSNHLLYNKYLKSPISLLHKINKIIKILLLFFSLSIIPNYSNIYLVIHLLSIIIFNYILDIKKNKSLNIFNILYIIILYINSSINTIIKYPSISFYIPYNMKIFINKSLCCYYIYNIYYLKYTIPEFLLRMIFIIIIYFSYLNILFKSTELETIIIFFVNLYKATSQYFNYSNYYLIRISTLTYQSIERLIMNVNSICLSINLKFIKLPLYKYILLFYLMNNYFNKIFDDIYKIKTHLWNRQMIL